MILPDPKANQTPTPTQPRTQLLTDDSGTPTCLCPHLGGPALACSVCLWVRPGSSLAVSTSPGPGLAGSLPTLVLSFRGSPGQPILSSRLRHVDFICVTALTHLRDGDASESHSADSL